MNEPKPQTIEQGSLKLHIDHQHGKVILDFGQSVSHLILDTNQAQLVAMLLNKHAIAARFTDT